MAKAYGRTNGQNLWPGPMTKAYGQDLWPKPMAKACGSTALPGPMDKARDQSRGPRSMADTCGQPQPCDCRGSVVSRGDHVTPSNRPETPPTRLRTPFYDLFQCSRVRFFCFRGTTMLVLCVGFFHIIFLILKRIHHAFLSKSLGFAWTLGNIT